MIAEIKKAVQSFERRCLPRQIEQAANESSAPTIADQVSVLMSVSTPASTTTTTKREISVCKSFSRVLRYAFREQRLDTGFICGIFSTYTRLVLQKMQKRVVDIYNKEALRARHTKRIWTRQIGPSSLLPATLEMQQQYYRQGKQKIYELLMANNAGIADDIAEYKQGYKERHAGVG